MTVDELILQLKASGDRHFEVRVRDLDGEVREVTSVDVADMTAEVFLRTDAEFAVRIPLTAADYIVLEAPDGTIGRLPISTIPQARRSLRSLADYPRSSKNGQWLDDLRDEIFGKWPELDPSTKFPPTE